MVALAPNSCIPYREYGMQLQQSGGKYCSLGGFFRKAGTDSRIAQNLRGETRNIPRAFWQDVSRPTTIEMDTINSLEELEEILQHSKDNSQPIVIDWFIMMAAWCRKCVYLKPKLEKLSAEFFPRMKFYFVDVNKVSQALVKRGNISKMPTIQIWKDGEFKAEVIGGHKAWQVLDEVREMIQKYTIFENVLFILFISGLLLSSWKKRVSLCIATINSPRVELAGCKGIWTIYHKNSRDASKSISDNDLIISLENRTMVRLQRRSII